MSTFTVTGRTKHVKGGIKSFGGAYRVWIERERVRGASQSPP